MRLFMCILDNCWIALAISMIASKQAFALLALTQLTEYCYSLRSLLAVTIKNINVDIYNLCCIKTRAYCVMSSLILSEPIHVYTLYYFLVSEGMNSGYILINPNLVLIVVSSSFRGCLSMSLPHSATETCLGSYIQMEACYNKRCWVV